MTDLALPVPQNLHLAPGVRATALVEGDVYDICNRIRTEVDPSLFIMQLTEDDGHDCAFAIMEHCKDGVDRLVYKTKELDARILDKCRYMLQVPLEKRVQELEKELKEWEAAERQRLSDELYEKLGAPMRREFERCGFTNPKRSISYPKVAGRL